VSKATKRQCTGTVQSQGGTVGNVIIIIIIIIIYLRTQVVTGNKNQIDM